MIRLTLYILTTMLFFGDVVQDRSGYWTYAYVATTAIFLYLSLTEWRKAMIATIILVPNEEGDTPHLLEVK